MMFISNFSFLHNYFCFCWITYADVTITFLKFAYCFPKDNNDDDDDDDDDDDNNNNNNNKVRANPVLEKGL